jgi:hypothetical protein
VDQLALAFAPPPGVGHNQPPEPIDPIEGLSERLATSHADLLAASAISNSAARGRGAGRLAVQGL